MKAKSNNNVLLAGREFLLLDLRGETFFVGRNFAAAGVSFIPSQESRVYSLMREEFGDMTLLGREEKKMVLSFDILMKANAV